jgi:hypothetical protein
MDARRNAAFRNDLYLAYGVAYLALDMPGPAKSSFRDRRAGRRARVFGGTRLSWPEAPDLDAKRVGRLWRVVGRPLAARVAVTERARIRGAVLQGAPVQEYFQPGLATQGNRNPRIPVRAVRARAAIYGASTLDAFLAYGPEDVAGDLRHDRQAVRADIC